jgi:diaminohydroxyphosphoribosylaminopyrimidine deaminase/5-amino-6-(5-phosphoribosylamino)uracil reductase
MSNDATFMSRALELAALGRWTVSPNPMVGCVLVRDGEIVGEGHHVRAGEPHAEIIALGAAGSQADGATAYVTLEPCDHTGRTPPCSHALLDAGVRRVVVAVNDPNPLAAGGAATLRAAGVAVELGVLEQQARQLNTVFFHGVQTQRPYVIAKVATSLDGRIAAADGTSQWLTGEQARGRAHELRAEVDAVVVGSGTVLADDPQLTCRLEDYDAAQPLRVVLDRRGRVTPDHRVCDDSAPTLLTQAEPEELLSLLWGREVRSILVEGGATVLHAFLAAGLVDRLHVHIAPVLLGQQGRPLLAGPWADTLAEAPRYHLAALERTGDDTLLTLTPAKSADDTFSGAA